MTQLEFTKGMTLLTVAYPRLEVDQTTMEVWYSFFEDIRADVFIAAVKSFVRSSKFAPTINELLQYCEDCKGRIQNETLNEMLSQGYFHRGVDDNQAMRNFEKACRWVERGTEPQWLKDDMRQYYKLKLSNESQLRLKGGDMNAV
ncbi:MAG: replicative helicase loader/inhibitor [Turicibacter sp.]